MWRPIPAGFRVPGPQGPEPGPEQSLADHPSVPPVSALWRIAKGCAEKKAILVDGGARLSFKLQLIQHRREFAPVDGKARRSDRRLASVNNRRRLSAAGRSVGASRSAAMSLVDTDSCPAPSIAAFGRLGAKNGTCSSGQLSWSVVSCFVWRASPSHTRDRSTRDDMEILRVEAMMGVCGSQNRRRPSLGRLQFLVCVTAQVWS